MREADGPLFPPLFAGLGMKQITKRPCHRLHQQPINWSNSSLPLHALEYWEWQSFSSLPRFRINSLTNTILKMKSFLRRILPFVHSLKGSAILKTCSFTSRQEFGRQFEEIVVQSLRKLSVDVAACGGPKDRGIDFRGVWRLKSSSMRVIGQCKRYKKRLGPKHIRELEGSLTHEVKETLGIIVSESGWVKCPTCHRDDFYPVICHQN